MADRLGMDRAKGGLYASSVPGVIFATACKKALGITLVSRSAGRAPGGAAGWCCGRLWLWGACGSLWRPVVVGTARDVCKKRGTGGRYGLSQVGQQPYRATRCWPGRVAGMGCYLLLGFPKYSQPAEFLNTWIFQGRLELLKAGSPPPYTPI